MSADEPEHDAGVDAQLVAAQDLPPAPCTGQKQKREIDRRDEHEDHDDPVDRRGLVVGDAFVADGEAAGRDGRERGGHRVEPRHPRRAERERFRRREENVDAVKHFGRVAFVRGSSLEEMGPGLSAFIRLTLPLAELWHQREQQDENAHAAEPLRQRAPELDAARQRGRRAEDGGARRREAGNGLKQRVHIAAAAAERIGAARRRRTARSSRAPRRHSRRGSAGVIWPYAAGSAADRPRGRAAP